MSGQKAERVYCTPRRTRSAGVAGKSGTIASAVRQANEDNSVTFRTERLNFTANSPSNSHSQVLGSKGVDGATICSAPFHKSYVKLTAQPYATRTNRTYRT
eukprot:1947005-Pyramimonas_sp.AAC.1